MAPEFLTIGVYGWDAERFFESLRGAGVDTFCDLRRRRGVRGSRYAWANSARLQARLAEVGIRYLHFERLAPSIELRKRQEAVDRAEKTAKRRRDHLSPEFIAGYREECLAAFDAGAFLRDLGPEARRVALFCVEGPPEACHRSLFAGELETGLGARVEHLLPPA